MTRYDVIAIALQTIMTLWLGFRSGPQRVLRKIYVNEVAGGKTAVRAFGKHPTSSIAYAVDATAVSARNLLQPALPLGVCSPLGCTAPANSLDSQCLTTTAISQARGDLGSLEPCCLAPADMPPQQATMPVAEHGHRGGLNLWTSSGGGRCSF